MEPPDELRSVRLLRLRFVWPGMIAGHLPRRTAPPRKPGAESPSCCAMSWLLRTPIVPRRLRCRCGCRTGGPRGVEAGGESSVGCDRAAGDEACVEGCEEDGHGGDIGRVAKALLWRAVFEHLLQRRAEHLCHRCIDKAGGNRVDADIMRGEGDRH